MIEQLREAFYSATTKLEYEILKIGGKADHVHLLVAYLPKLAVNNLKQVSSRMLR
ncbi:transposase [Escherichia coli]|nr:transposase [Escherichia coli]